MLLTMAMAYGLLFTSIVTFSLASTFLVREHDIAYLLGRGSKHVRGRA